jgi:TetR/AcrR family transcriptional regulator
MVEPERRDGRTRDANLARVKILDAAEAAFAMHGFDGARIEAIARASGYNVSLLFQYFDDKLGLYAAVLKRIDTEISELQERFVPMFEDENFASNADKLRIFLETMVRTLFDYLLEHPRFLRILTWEMAEGWQTYIQVVPRLHLEDSDQFETLFRPAQSAGLIRANLSPVIQMALILQICQTYLAFLPLYQMLLPHDDISSAKALAQAREYLVALMVRGMMVDSRDDEKGGEK